MKNTIFTYFSCLFFLWIYTGCEDDSGPDGKVNMTLDATSAFKSENPDPTTTTVIWGCVVLNETTTACMYYYNGIVQIDNNMSTDAINAGPGTNGFTFVLPGNTFDGLDGGNHSYFFYKATFNNSDGSLLGAITDLTGELDLYANPGTEGQAGDDRSVIVTFGSSGAPSVDDL